MKIEASSRILLFAAHPDDEALAAGGLLRRGAALGATAHVVFATNGDDNPWPHRLLERRWKIEVGDRMLWGMRRAEEAINALATLGLPANCAQFLHLPDQRITELFLQGNPQLLDRLAKIIEATRPNLVLAPSPFDLHPDHSALYLLLQLALARAGQSRVEQLCYEVHTRGYHSDWNRVSLDLTSAEQEVKRRAILCHRSQMALSRARFLRHVQPVEKFWRPAAPREVDLHHPVRGARLTNGSLMLHLRRRRRARTFARCTLLVALQSELHRGQRWALRLRRNSGMVEIRNAATGAVLGSADVQIDGLDAKVAFHAAAPADHIFVKLQQPSLFFDSAGWREIPSVALEPADAVLLSLLRPRKLRRRPRLKARAAR